MNLLMIGSGYLFLSIKRGMNLSSVGGKKSNDWLRVPSLIDTARHELVSRVSIFYGKKFSRVCIVENTREKERKREREIRKSKEKGKMEGKGVK
jgi:hypothetical protein